MCHCWIQHAVYSGRNGKHMRKTQAVPVLSSKLLPGRDQRGFAVSSATK
ncbi:hypothetical protein GJA_3417 [Janthinobacterium agaricidamnosum NBRC 102515 = DSM 9628]|uniref:Uncharacterized protein n=1 Tax=Janthinobacterium agaricidamnosum NBRC 102515 = DSM 9628 TaxID=1349767 RepID=W0V827_9BURK|nr:hypothetical protein GJA_3417 [Janthinobacterium agaricidamnosum NBRC 102515 = DSM 9628]